MSGEGHGEGQLVEIQQTGVIHHDVFLLETITFQVRWTVQHDGKLVRLLHLTRSHFVNDEVQSTGPPVLVARAAPLVFARWIGRHMPLQQ